VPTTAGTGSEVTVAAVISDPERQAKLVIVDTRLVPKMAALDPCLMTGLPPHITAATGIDALTHAIESFIGKWANPTTDDMALSAVGLIFDNLRVAYSDGKNLAAREKMALAATYAGLPSPAPMSATCMPSRTSSAASTTRRMAWPMPSCCRWC
jgi:alcohol dehydrogenase